MEAGLLDIEGDGSTLMGPAYVISGSIGGRKLDLRVSDENVARCGAKGVVGKFDDLLKTLRPEEP